MKRYLLGFAAVVTALVGCAPSVSSQIIPPRSAYVQYDLPDNSVYEFKLHDGTRCVVSNGYFSGGITCNWK